MMLCAPSMTDFIPDAQTLLTVVQTAVFGSPDVVGLGSWFEVWVKGSTRIRAVASSLHTWRPVSQAPGRLQPSEHDP